MAPRPRLALPAALAALVLSRGARGFAAKSTSLVEMRRRSLVKKTSSTPATQPKRKRRNPRQREAAQREPLRKSFLLEALEEALFRQDAALEALDREVERKREEMDRRDNRDVEASEQQLPAGTIHHQRRHVFVAPRLGEKSCATHPSDWAGCEPPSSKPAGSCPNQRWNRCRPRSSWKSTKAREQEFGRPLGFDGEVFYSPLGVPILVGRMNAHKDEVLRNAAQGSDLWFQVEDYNRARVLLRTSLRRGTEGSRQCKQMAADLAAKFSVWGEEHDSIPIMYTDSRKVAKRGSKVGSMKKRKSLGRILGYPRNV